MKLSPTARAAPYTGALWMTPAFLVMAIVLSYAYQPIASAALAMFFVGTASGGLIVIGDLMKRDWLRSLFFLCWFLGGRLVNDHWHLSFENGSFFACLMFGGIGIGLPLLLFREKCFAAHQAMRERDTGPAFQG